MNLGCYILSDIIDGVLTSGTVFFGEDVVDLVESLYIGGYLLSLVVGRAFVNVRIKFTCYFL